MARRILLIDGHPDLRPERLARALVKAYADGAESAGHDVRVLQVGALDLPLIRSAEEFTSKHPPSAAVAAQEAVLWAQHLVIVHPLWLGGPPAQLKGFFEQVFRYGFAIPESGRPRGLLKGRSASIVVTMGMPAFAFRLLFGAFGIRSLERSVLRLSGIRSVRRIFFGGVGAASPRVRDGWLRTLRRRGAAAS